MRISTRLIVLVTAAVLGIACVVAVSLHALSNALIATRQAEAVNLLTKAEHMIHKHHKNRICPYVARVETILATALEK